MTDVIVDGIRVEFPTPARKGREDGKIFSYIAKDLNLSVGPLGVKQVTVRHYGHEALPEGGGYRVDDNVEVIVDLGRNSAREGTILPGESRNLDIPNGKTLRISHLK